MKKWLVLVCAMVLATFVMAKVVTIEVWTLSLSPTFDDYLNAVVESFEKANPGIKVNLVDIPYGAALQKLQAAIAAGKAPDAVNLNTPWTIDLAAMEALQPIDDYVTEVEKYLYWEKLWNATVIDGKSYAVPWYGSPMVLIYNRQIFEEAGLDPDNPPQTFEEMLEVSRIIRERTGVYGFEPNINGYLDLITEGVPMVTPDGKKAAFNTPKAIEKLKWYQTLYNEELIPRSLGGYIAGKQDYSAGKIAMYPVGITMLKHIQVNSPSIFAVTDVAPHPIGDGKILKNSIMNFSIPVNAKHPREAVKFVLWMTSPYWQIQFGRHATILPSTKISYDSDTWFIENAETNLLIKAQVMAAKASGYAADISRIPGLDPEKHGEFTRILNDYFLKAIKGEYTAEEALAKAEEEINELLEK